MAIVLVVFLLFSYFTVYDCITSVYPDPLPGGDLLASVAIHWFGVAEESQSTVPTT